MAELDGTVGLDESFTEGATEGLSEGALETKWQALQETGHWTLTTSNLHRTVGLSATHEQRLL